MPHYVYKYVYHDEIIYIGKTDCELEKRLCQHGKPGDNIPKEGWAEINASDIYYIKFPNRTMSDVVESELIRRYKPKYNKAKTSEWGGLPFTEPEWTIWRGLNDRAELKYKCNLLQIECDKYKKYNEELIRRNEELANSLEYEKQKALNHYIYDLIIESLYGNDVRSSKTTMDGITFDEILTKYKTTDKQFAYVSRAYDKNSDLICEKLIYTNGYGHLEFAFYQFGCHKQNGSIYLTRDDKTKCNHQVLRNWINRGNNVYYPVTKDDIPSLFQSMEAKEIKKLMVGD